MEQGSALRKARQVLYETRFCLAQGKAGSYVQLLTFLILKIILISGAINLGGFIITTFTIIPPNHFLQHITPRMITANARTLNSQVEGRHIAITQPKPKANHKKSLGHIFFIGVNTSHGCIYYIL